MTQIPLDFTASRAARDRGIEQAAGNAAAWIEMALHDLVRFVRSHGEATVEAWRFDWLTRRLPEPPTHKCYGALTNVAARRRLIEHTGRYVRAQAAKTHAHPVALWRAT